MTIREDGHASQNDLRNAQPLPWQMVQRLLLPVNPRPSHPLARLPVGPKGSLEHSAAAPAIDATAAEFPNQVMVLSIYRSAADIVYGNWWIVPAHLLSPLCPATAGRSLTRSGHVVTTLTIPTARMVNPVGVATDRSGPA